MTRFLVVPQWQGSPSARAMLLVDGADAIAEDLPKARTRVLDVPLEAGDAQGTSVQRLSSLRRTHDLIVEALSGDDDEMTILVGGDCSVSVGAITSIPGELDDVALVWFDAHPDLHTPSTSPSGAYAGMALRAALGDPHSPLPARSGLSPDRVVLVGARAVDPAEDTHLRESGITRLSPDELAIEGALTRAVAATGASRVYVHIDVDVLDPAHLTGVSMPAPFGAEIAHLVSSLRDLRAQTTLIGATVAGFAPRTRDDAVDDLGAILRVIGALA